MSGYYRLNDLGLSIGEYGMLYRKREEISLGRMFKTKEIKRGGKTSQKGEK